MIETLAKAAGCDVPRETIEKLKAYVALLKEENTQQNLVSAASLESSWDRHIVDSAQLLRFNVDSAATWADIGSGAGLPGIVIACFGRRVGLIEPRRLRAEFLCKVIGQLGLDATLQTCKAQRATGTYDVITGRAVAKLGQFLDMSAHLSTGKTVWVLPKGMNSDGELAGVQRTWHGVFHVEQSLTDADSKIIVATGVHKRR